MSPISAENRARYPKDWPEISRAIKERAGWRCECRGECGRHHCGPTSDDGRRACFAAHGDYGYRTDDGEFVRLCSDAESLGGADRVDGRRVVRIVLTTAHLNHEPEDCRPDNLRAFCQACHLRYDGEIHRENARRTREKKNGTEPLFALGGREQA